VINRRIDFAAGVLVRHAPCAWLAMVEDAGQSILIQRSIRGRIPVVATWRLRRTPLLLQHMSTPIRLAVLDERLSAQLDTRPATEGLEVVWKGAVLAQLEQQGPRLKPNVLVLDLELLGAEPAATIDRLRDQCGSDLVFAVYTFAKRDLLANVERTSARLMQSPVSLDRLRAQMTGLIVRHLLGRGDEVEMETTPTPSVPAAPRRSDRDVGALAATAVDARPVPPPRFTPAQLGKLAELESSIECECPNHLADLLTRLGAFERYSAGCASRNEEDAAVHRMLNAETGRARAVLEAALTRLLEFEKIAI
jgi:hypothetical protein